MEMAAYTDVFTATTAATIPIGSRYLLDGAIGNAMVEYATATYADALGLRPSLGRWFDETEQRPGAPLVAVLGYQTWTRVFRADPSVVGRVIHIDGVPVTIVGVGPANHRGTVDIGVGTDFWLPITALPTISESAGRAAPTIFAPLLVKARLREGVTVAQAQAAMDILGRRLAADFPETSPRRRVCLWASASRSLPRQTCASTRRRTRRRWRSLHCCSSSSRSSSRSRAATWRRCCSCAAPRARKNFGSACNGRDAASARSAPLDRERPAVAGGRHRRLPPRVVGHARAATNRLARNGGPDPRLPRARLRDRAVGGYRRGVRPCARSEGHEARPDHVTARRGAAADRSSAAHTEERADRLSGRGFGAAARGHERFPSNARGDRVARRLCRRRRRDARDRRAVRRLLG